MGHGIAQVCAQAGLEVTLYDVAEEPLARGLKGIAVFLAKGVEKGKMPAAEADAVRARVRGSTQLAEACAGAQVVIEAVPENLDLKRHLLAEVERMHFFNPVPLMALLEIVQGPRSGAAAVDEALALGRRLGKEPIVVKDAPGFASSRLGVAIGLEAIRMVEEGVASPADIDKAMELGYRHPMGPLRLTDLVGLDVRLGIAEYLARELGPRFTPPRLLREMVAAGKLGKKSGQGFYAWE